MNTPGQLSRRVEELEQACSQDNKIHQFPELRKLMQLADTGLENMYHYFDAHALQGIYPDTETRRAMIPDIYRNVQSFPM